MEIDSSVFLPFTVQTDSERRITASLSNLADTVVQRYAPLPQLRSTIFGFDTYASALADRWAEANIGAKRLVDTLGESHISSALPNIEHAIRPYALQGADASKMCAFTESISPYLRIPPQINICTLQADGTLSLPQSVDDGLQPHLPAVSNALNFFTRIATLRSHTYGVLGALCSADAEQSLDRIAEFSETLSRPFDVMTVVPLIDRLQYGEMIVESMRQKKSNEYLLNYFANRVFHLFDSGIAFADAQKIAHMDFGQVAALYLARINGHSPEDARDSAVSDFNVRTLVALRERNFGTLYDAYVRGTRAFIEGKQSGAQDEQELQKEFSLSLLPTEVREKVPAESVALIARQCLTYQFHQFGPSPVLRFFTFRNGLLAPRLSHNGGILGLEEGFDISTENRSSVATTPTLNAGNEYGASSAPK